MQSNPVSFWNVLTVFCLSVHHRDRPSCGKFLPNLPCVACLKHKSDLSFHVCGSDIAKLICGNGNVTHTGFYRCFIIDKCPSHAINPVDTITLTLLFFSYLLKHSDMHAHIYSVFWLCCYNIGKTLQYFVFLQYTVIWKNTEMSTRLIE